MSNTDLASVQAIVYGYVQGVYFRNFVAQRASALGLVGYVHNLHDMESVEVVAEGERKRLEELISHLHVGPPSARVERVITTWSEHSGRYTNFRIRY